MPYDLVQNYSMKCRLYPTPAQKQKIEDALTAVRIYHNCLVYDIWNNNLFCTEKPKKASETGEKVHFFHTKGAFTKEYKDKLLLTHPIINACPSGALLTNVGLQADIKRELDVKRPIEHQKPSYCGAHRPRTSYTYQETLSKIKPSENPKVLFVELAKIGRVKLRGWNPKLRFENEETDFVAWAKADPKKQITVTVSKDTVGDYYLIFLLQNCLKPFAPLPDEAHEVGVDVGIKEIAILSDGEKFPNKTFKKGKKKHQRALNRRLSRRYGPSNEKFRRDAKKNRAERKKFFAQTEQDKGEPPKLLQPSKRYAKTRLRHARLNRKIQRRREAWNHEVSRKIVERHSLIALESLNIKGMLRNRHLAFALSDVALEKLLRYIEYKAHWHGRTVCAIGQWTPSSKRCSGCGYIYSSRDQYHLKPWNLGIRAWRCPCCHAQHDRDINAARNILYYAKNATTA